MTTTPQQPAEDLDELQVYPRDQWYVAALSSEVGRTLIERILLGGPLVLYWGERGEVIALHNRCPHRYYPLSNGKVIETRSSVVITDSGSHYPANVSRSHRKTTFLRVCEVTDEPRR